MATVADHPTPAGVDPQALIEEARERHRRRRMWVVGVVALLVLATGLYAAVYSEHSGSGQRFPGRPHPSEAFHLLPGGPSLGPATAYQLTGPLAVALDPVGDLYFTDGNQVFRVDHLTHDISVVAGRGTRVDRSGKTFWGDGGPALQAGLDAPFDIAIARDGDLFIADGDFAGGNDRVRRVSAATGIITTVAGNGRIGSAGDGGPATRAELNLSGAGFGSSSIALAPNGDLYIADGGSNRIRKVSAATGIITTVAGNGVRGSSGDGASATRAELDHPAGITFDSHGDLFVASGTRIREISAATGVIRTVYGPVHGSSLIAGQPAYDLAFSPSGTLYFSTLYGRAIKALNLATHHVAAVSGTGQQTIQQRGAAAGDGGPARQATFGLAAGLTVNSQGDIYIADFFNNSVRRIDASSGIISNVAGQIPQSPAHCC